MRTWTAAASVLLLCSCFKLDPFLYEPVPTEHYVFDPQGLVPEETVAPERIEPVRVPVNDQVSLGAVYVHANVQPPYGYALFFHGKGGNLDTNMTRAKRLANMGFDTLAIDYRGWGTSTRVTPDEAGIGEDARAARAWLLARVGSSNATRLMYYGHSLGVAIALQLATQYAPAGLVLESGFASITDFGENSTLLAMPSSFYAKDDWNNVARAGLLQSPVLFFHGKLDDLSRWQCSQKMYDAAPEPKRLILVEGASHSDIPMVLGRGMEIEIKSFLGPHLQ